MRHLLFAVAGILRTSYRLSRTGLALVGLGFVLLVAAEPGPVLREAVHRARLLRAWVAYVPVRPPVPLEDAPPIHWPADGRRISSGFGTRIHPITGRSQHHRGVDLPLPVGSPVRAARPGRVSRVADDPLNGLHVILHDDEAGLRFAYAHLSAVHVQPGATVQAGDVLAASGNTGRSTGPHLHFGAWKDGVAVDPRRFRTLDPPVARAR